MRLLLAFVGIFVAAKAVAAPAGFVKTMIPLAAPPAGLAFDAAGALYALERADEGNNETILKIFDRNGVFFSSFPVIGEGPGNFYVGAMTFDTYGQRILITDNTTGGLQSGKLYGIDLAGNKQILVEGITNIAGVAARTTGEIFVSSAPNGGGVVYQVNNSIASPVAELNNLGYGAGLAFTSNGDLVVQDANSATFLGRLQQLPITALGSTLAFGTPVPLLDSMQSSAGVVVVGNEFYTTGIGGLYRVAGSPRAETVFDRIDPFQFATAIAFDPGSKSFEPFAGSSGGRLVYTAAFDDPFITVLTPAEPGDYNGDGHVNALDYAVWQGAFGSDDSAADGNRDGHVDAEDYVLWREHLSPSAAATIGGMGVPEPAVSALVATIFLIRLGRRRRPICREQRVCTAPPAKAK